MKDSESEREETKRETDGGRDEERERDRQFLFVDNKRKSPRTADSDTEKKMYLLDVFTAKSIDANLCKNTIGCVLYQPEVYFQTGLKGERTDGTFQTANYSVR